MKIVLILIMSLDREKWCCLYWFSYWYNWDIVNLWFTKLCLYGFYGHPKSTAVVFVLLSRTTFDPSIFAEFTDPFGESDFDFFTVDKGFSEAGWAWKGTGPWFERFEMRFHKKNRDPGLQKSIPSPLPTPGWSMSQFKTFNFELA